MDLSVRDVARLLNVSENTVYRWARAGTIPFQRVHEQYRFNRVELQEWAALHKHRVSADLFHSVSTDERSPRLSIALERGGVFHGVPGDDREQALRSVTRLPGIPAKVDRDLLCQLLVAREVLAPTGVGDGVAIPHPRDPLVVHVEEPVVLLCFLTKLIDFRALDGEPVRVLFLLLSPTVREHLQILSRLAFALHDPALRELLRVGAESGTILPRIRELEEQTPLSTAGHQGRERSNSPARRDS